MLPVELVIVTASGTLNTKIPAVAAPPGCPASLVPPPPFAYPLAFLAVSLVITPLPADGEPAAPWSSDHPHPPPPAPYVPLKGPKLERVIPRPPAPPRWLPPALPPAPPAPPPPPPASGAPVPPAYP